MLQPTSPAALSGTFAPAAIGPYSPAVVAGPFRYASGQLPIDPATGELGGFTAAEQAHRSIADIEALPAEAGLTLGHVVKTTVLLADMNDFAAVNEVYARRFRCTRPARCSRWRPAAERQGRDRGDRPFPGAWSAECDHEDAAVRTT